ncbi:MAG: hypothetical protein V4733_09920 [Verrucomicrobiota bacterium]
MKSAVIPVICSIALTAMITAVASHWRSVESLVAWHRSVPAAESVIGNIPEVHHPSPSPGAAPVVADALPAAPARTVDITDSRKDFYDALLSKMESLQNQNRDLHDQLGETNRELMKMEFRLDTHSASFRPLNLVPEPSENDEDRSKSNATIGIPDAGVLPPRADPVDLPVFE